MRSYTIIFAGSLLLFPLKAFSDPLPLRSSNALLAPPLLYLHYPFPWSEGGASASLLFLKGLPERFSSGLWGGRIGGFWLSGAWTVGGGLAVHPEAGLWGGFLGGGLQLLRGDQESSSVFLGGGVAGIGGGSEAKVAPLLFVEVSKEMARIPMEREPLLLYIGAQLDQGYGFAFAPAGERSLLSPFVRAYLRGVFLRRYGIAYALGTQGQGVFVHALEFTLSPRGYP